MDRRLWRGKPSLDEAAFHTQMAREYALVLDQRQVVGAFQRKQEQFQHFAATLEEQQAAFQSRLDALVGKERTDVEARLADLGVDWPGALPTSEFDIADGLRISLGQKWANHQEARLWARDVLHRRPTVAVDGSQITPAGDYSVPVGAVQIGWFINPHDQGGEYVKDLAFDVLAPSELSDEDDEGEESFATQTVNQERFVRECEKLREIILSYAARPDDEKPLCFFDGSLIISFAGKIRASRARHYIGAIGRLLQASESCRVPLVAFVDTSLSRDIVTLIRLLSGQQSEGSLSDGGLLRRRLSRWGDRSPLFRCARGDGLSLDGRADFYRTVLFTYVHLSSDRPPARIELPQWIHAEGRTQEIIDLVLAECVVGAGYPYAIETADALAVISRQDRERFYALFQRFVQENGLEFSVAAKSRSKRIRR